MTDNVKWNRHRFHANEDDYRPMIWPPPGPYWCSGYGDGYSIVIAYAPDDTDMLKYWPEMEEDDIDKDVEITFSGRFPQPEWWPLDDSTT